MQCCQFCQHHLVLYFQKLGGKYIHFFFFVQVVLLVITRWHRFLLCFCTFQVFNVSPFLQTLILQQNLNQTRNLKVLVPEGQICKFLSVLPCLAYPCHQVFLIIVVDFVLLEKKKIPHW